MILSLILNYVLITFIIGLLFYYGGLLMLMPDQAPLYAKTYKAYIRTWAHTHKPKKPYTPKEDEPTKGEIYLDLESNNVITQELTHGHFMVISGNRLITIGSFYNPDTMTQEHITMLNVNAYDRKDIQ